MVHVSGRAGLCLELAVCLCAEACGGSSGSPTAPARAASTDGGPEAGDVSPEQDGSSGDEQADDSSDDNALLELPSSMPASDCSPYSLTPDQTGAVSSATNPYGIAGQWYTRVDCDDYALSDAGLPMPGVNCSLVRSPADGSPFVPAEGTARMCSSGTTVRVESDSEWPVRWGADIGLSLNGAGGQGSEGGAPLFDATSAGVHGFCFFIAAASMPPFRVRVTSDQGFDARNQYLVTMEGEGWHHLAFTDLKQVAPSGTPFDPSRILGIELEIPSSKEEQVSWDYCVDALTPF